MRVSILPPETKAMLQPPFESPRYLIVEGDKLRLEFWAGLVGRPQSRQSQLKHGPIMAQKYGP
jgi:hypothetical protein